MLRYLRRGRMLPKTPKNMNFIRFVIKKFGFSMIFIHLSYFPEIPGFPDKLILIFLKFQVFQKF